MEDIFKMNPPLLSSSCSDNVVRVGNTAFITSEYLQLEVPEPDRTGSGNSDRLIKNQIANHPLFPDLVSAYIQCQKVGAPPEVASMFEEIGRESHSTGARGEIGDDPELDDFMGSYCEVVRKLKEDLSKPFNEATLFLCNMESQFNNLCNVTLKLPSDINNNRSGNDLLNCVIFLVS
ncbi:hypothetical protein Lal_00000231 [Lupinus albus]|nr:hypothetical protein Lal_00000231 [Lupinus albus]